MARASRGLACDTSVLIAALSAWHPRHESAREAGGRLRAVPAHVLLETYSTLTRLPVHRVSAQVAHEAVAGLGLSAIALPAERHLEVIAALSRHGIKGGAVYDGLIAATAAHHDLPLLTMDRRARATYDALGVSYVVV
jgi:predicted nucleic acid-binding protein